MDDIYEIAIRNHLISREDASRTAADNERSSSDSITNLLNSGVQEGELYQVLARETGTELVLNPTFLENPRYVKKEHLEYFQVKVVEETENQIVLAGWLADRRERVIGAFENLYGKRVVFVLVTATDFCTRNAPN